MRLQASVCNTVFLGLGSLLQFCRQLTGLIDLFSLIFVAKLLSLFLRNRASLVVAEFVCARLPLTSFKFTDVMSVVCADFKYLNHSTFSSLSTCLYFASGSLLDAVDEA